MKKTTVSMIAMSLAVSALAAFAQEPPAATPPGNPPAKHEGRRGGPGEGPMREVLESLTPAERTQYKEARKKAMEDPAVVEAKKSADAARKEAFDAMKSNLLKQDPSLAPILDKMQEPGGMKALTPEERQKLQAARKATHPGKEGFRKAGPEGKAYHDALRAAMLKADPTIGPVLEKVDAAMKEKAGQMREEHNKNNPSQL